MPMNLRIVTQHVQGSSVVKAAKSHQAELCFYKPVTAEGGVSGLLPRPGTATSGSHGATAPPRGRGARVIWSAFTPWNQGHRNGLIWVLTGVAKRGSLLPAPDTGPLQLGGSEGCWQPPVLRVGLRGPRRVPLGRGMCVHLRPRVAGS